MIENAIDLKSLSRHRHQSQLRVRKMSRSNHLHHHPLEMSPVQVVAEDKYGSVFIVGRRPPLSSFPLIWQWLAKLVYKRLRWTGIDYGGVFLAEPEARFAASEYGGFYMEVPWGSCLPPETCQYGNHDFPLSRNSIEYRRRMFPFVAIHRDTLAKVFEFEQRLEELERKLDDLKCAA